MLINLKCQNVNEDLTLTRRFYHQRDLLCIRLQYAAILID